MKTSLEDNHVEERDLRPVLSARVRRGSRVLVSDATLMCVRNLDVKHLSEHLDSQLFHPKSIS